MPLGPDAVSLRDRIALVTGVAVGIGAAWRRPDDVAGAALFLASDLSRFVTGTTVHVDGENFAAGGWRRLADGSCEL